MNRNDLKRLANARRREAKRLLDAGSYPGAYYLAGMAIECAIKACIAKLTKRHDFPNKKHAQDSFDHDPMKLIKAARLEDDLENECTGSPQFEANWGVVAQWSIDSRYDPKLSEDDANELYSAIVSRKYGVLNWLRDRW